jgi:NAD(P)-dependent dehydrogenase (short-subunit alcohol dehydrogenase family)
VRAGGLAESLKAEVTAFGVKVMIVQPGPFRTEFISKGDMSRGRGATYAQSVGRFAALLAGMPGKQPGDPARAASAMLDAIAAENTPLRLVLGKYAVNKQKTKLAAVGTELAAWEAVSAGTDGR